jgi:hypothetical protein
MRTPMPSPRGTNREGLFLRRSSRGPAAAYDEAPEGSQRTMLRRKARKYFESLYEDFCRATGIEDDDAEATDESACEPQHRAIAAAASQHSATDDLPRNAAARSAAMDELRRVTAHIRVEPDPMPRQAPRPTEQALRDAIAIAPGLEHIKCGP